MNLTRRAALLSGLCTMMGRAGAQGAWPAGKAVRMIVPFAAGGATDVAARVLAQALAESLKTSFVVENRAGGHGFVGITEVVKAQPDGYTLLMASIGTIGINPGLHAKLPYDANADFEPIGVITRTPVVLVVNPKNLPVSSIPELITYLKSRPGKVNYASAGAGGSSHLIPEYFKHLTGTSMMHVPYKGESAALADVMGGQVDLMFSTLLNAVPHLKSGRLRLLAVSTGQRLQEFPDVPTMAEGLLQKDFEVVAWQALYAPANTPPEIVKRLAAAVESALKAPAMVKRMAELGALPGQASPEHLAKFQRSEQERWKSVIQVANIKAD
ncbi:MAG: tripartite tricarboxylate transporter substrate binding protein [Rhodoferax sp.]|nr:tripartite tricarboxylate transporter substrate binding protein [Rhodoferax sp.]